MRPCWDDLRLFHIDLHLHAGTERPECYSALDYINFAVATGRRIIGVTDHWGRFLGKSKKTLLHYPGTLEGFRTYAADVRAAQEVHPDAIILFGPEMPLQSLCSEEGELAFTVPEVTFFLGEPGGCPSEMTYGEYLLRGVEQIARLREKHGRPGILAHPLRTLINTYVGKTGPGPKYPLHPPFPPLEAYDDPRAHVEELFGVNLRALADALVRYDVPVEINESSWGRILGQNHQSFAERYLFFFRALIEDGAGVVLGSDLHNIEHGAATPFAVALILGVRPRDMTFLRHWIGDPPG